MLLRGIKARRDGDRETATQILERTLALAGHAGQAEIEMSALLALISSAIETGASSRAEGLLRQAHRVVKRCKDPSRETLLLFTEAHHAAMTGDRGRASAAFEEVTAAADASDDHTVWCRAMINRAVLNLEDGAFELAADRLADALGRYHPDDGRRSLAIGYLGVMDLLLGRAHAAVQGRPS